ncbi:MAG: YfiM family protein [Chitinophagales bacterium]|nr:YfiM family protein [Chitinophagales bacterium]
MQQIKAIITVLRNDKLILLTVPFLLTFNYSVCAFESFASYHKKIYPLCNVGPTIAPQSANSILFLDSGKKAKPIRASWLEPSPTLNKKRLAGVLATATAAYGLALIGLDRIWYQQYPRGHFRFFDDSREWEQVDKCGHVFSTYLVSVYGYGLLRWSGMKPVPASLTSGALAFGFISFIEVLDGFSVGWGASLSDVAANLGGATLASLQYAIWKEQRLQLKYSIHLQPYPRGQLSQRANELFGTSFTEKIVKDYNNINTWLCINTASFFLKQNKARWLSIAIGYGAGNMYGGFENAWKDQDGNIIDRRDIPRYRRFLISVDADLTKVKTRNKLGKALLYALNVIKLPFPAIEFNTLGEVVFHPAYLFNFSMPVYLKR